MCVIKIQQQWVIIRGESRIEWADIAVEKIYDKYMEMIITVILKWLK